MFFTITEIGPKRAMTPEGFLICYDVPLARTGIQMYSAKEVYPPEKMPSNILPNDPIAVDRPEKAVFDALAMASAQGKILVDEHPEENGQRIDVTPENWRNLAMGHIINPRRGKGARDNLLLGDLVVTAREAIDKINNGKRELSCGYDAEYSPVSSGHLEQRNIRINHIALVDSGRCGAQCAIADSVPEGLEMESGRRTIFKKLREAFASRNPEVFETAVRDAEESAGPENHMHVHLGGGPGAKEETDMHDDEEHGGTHAEGGSDPIPGLTKRMDAMESKVGEMHKMMTDAFGGGRTHDRHRRDDDDRRRRDDDDRRHYDDDDRRHHDDDDDDRRHHDARDDDDRRHHDDDDDDRRHYDDDDDDRHHRRDARRRRDDDRRRDDRRHDDDDRRHRDAPPFGMEAPPGTGDSARKSRDSAFMAESYEETIAVAEILAPGIGIPSFDSKDKPMKTFDMLCSLRRKALERAWADLKTREVIEPVFNGDVAALSCEQLRPMFFAAGALKRQANNGAMRTTDSVGPLKALNGTPTIAEYNARKDALWAQQATKI